MIREKYVSPKRENEENEAEGELVPEGLVMERLDQQANQPPSAGHASRGEQEARLPGAGEDREHRRVPAAKRRHRGTTVLKSGVDTRGFVHVHAIGPDHVCSEGTDTVSRGSDVVSYTYVADTRTMCLHDRGTS